MIAASTTMARSTQKQPTAASDRSSRIVPSPGAADAPLPPNGEDKPTPRAWLLPVLILVAAVGGVYFRLFSAGFVGFDDDIHVYMNPALNPPTLRGLERIWGQSYQQLYVPLAYTILAAVAGGAQVPVRPDRSIGHNVSLDPAAFHAVGVAFHLANALLCFLLVRRLTRRTTVALLGALVFALHPLQVESVGWISELRGLSCSCLGLVALVALVLSRQTRDQAPTRSRLLWLASALAVPCAMLCKPVAVVLPLVALLIDRIVLGTRWRAALVTAAVWAAGTLPFAAITRALQEVPTAGASLWWQRPFVAGDALLFYLFKILLPIDLGIDYGRTPHVVMSQAWGFLAWAIPLGLIVLAYRNRRRRPLLWLGALLFVTFLLPSLGLVPFTFQAYSTVADRYAYLSLVGVGLVVADVVDQLRARKLALAVMAVALVALAVGSSNQSRYWVSNGDFLRHTLDVNPDAAFAYYNRADAERASGEYAAAIADYRACVEHRPTELKASIGLAAAYAALGRSGEAEATIASALATPGLATEGVSAIEFSDLGIMLMSMNQPGQALGMFARAAALEPSSPAYLFNLANALATVGKFAEAEVVFRRCLALAPTLAGAHTGLGIVLAETQRLAEARDEFRTALRLQPDEPSTLDNLKRAEALIAAPPP